MGKRLIYGCKKNLNRGDLIEEGQKTRIEDIALVCSNFNKMFHRRRPWLSKEEMKKLINR